MNTVLVENAENEVVVSEGASFSPNETTAAPTTLKSKLKKTTAKVGVTVLPSDTPAKLDDLVHAVENLDQESAFSALRQFEDKKEENFFIIGGLLPLIRRKKWYTKSFDHWVKQNTALSRSTAHGYAQVYDKLTELQLDWPQGQQLSWTKLRCIAPVLTKENADKWIKRAEEQSRAALVHLVAKALRHQSSSGASNGASQFKLEFTVKKNQKEVVQRVLQRAKEEAKATNDSAAFWAICKQYDAAPTLAVRLQQAGFTKAVEALSEAYPGKFNYNGDAGSAEEHEDSTEQVEDIQPA